MESREIQDVQQALHDLGFVPGEIDGIWGRQTISALARFQNNLGLKVDGILGPLTIAKLNERAAPPIALEIKSPPWFIEATRLVNTREFLGKRNNPLILDWGTNLGIPYKGDDVPWCGLFVGHCISMALPDEVMPNGLLSARAWLKCEVETAPRVGAVMVFWRDARDDWKGHVGFYAGEDDHNYRILGGNQSDSVCYTWISKDRLLGARWPKSARSLLENARIVRVEKTEDLSSKET